MAEDVREAILARLVVLMGSVVGTDSVSRNVIIDDDGNAKRITVMEGEEIASDADPVNRPPTAPRIVHMQPQLILSAQANSAEVGSDLSNLRGHAIKLIASDTTLISLTLNGRSGRYIGMESDLAFGKAMFGQMALKFQFSYVMRPDQF
jgi:hypothetical protein